MQLRVGSAGAILWVLFGTSSGFKVHNEETHLEVFNRTSTDVLQGVFGVWEVNFTRGYVDGAFTSRQLARAQCWAKGYAGLCLQSELVGYANCKHGWLEDYKGFWFHQTLPGCGNGVGLRNGNARTSLGAYCCHAPTPIKRAYVGGYVHATREAGEAKCKYLGYAGLCTKAEVEGFAKCACGWMTDYKGYWYHETATGCGGGAGYRGCTNQANVGTYCCHDAPAVQRTFVTKLLSSRELAKGYCQSLGYQGLCSSTDVEGFSRCIHGWMSDYKGYWYHETETGCGTGSGLRDGSNEGSVGAYCCHESPPMARLYVGGYDYADRYAAVAQCWARGYLRLCSKAELEGWANCACGWTNDWKGYWFHQTATGCGGGVGYRNCDQFTSVGAHCCHEAAPTERKYVGGYDYTSRDLARGKCQAEGYERLCNKAEVEGYAQCNYGWMEDYKGYWYHKTENGCGGGAGWRDGDYRTSLGAYCCQKSPVIDRLYVGGYDYSSRALAEGKCKEQGFQRLCTKAELKGYAQCACGWTSDWKGYWYDRTVNGCGGGVGYRQCNQFTSVGAYCCDATVGELPKEYVGGYDYTSRTLAEGKCQAEGYERLCSKAEVEGWSNCLYGWMSDFRGYWYHKTESGCGDGAAFRNGDYRTSLGAYCCGLSPSFPREYVGGYDYTSREFAEAKCQEQGYLGLCTKAEVKGYGKCACGWMTDFKGYWYHKTENGCGGGVGYRSCSNSAVGAFCCHKAPVIQKEYVGGYIFTYREAARDACVQKGYAGLCRAAEIQGWSNCAFGWLSDWRGYWFHKTLNGCSSGPGYRDGRSEPALGAYCCHAATAEVAAVPRGYVGGYDYATRELAEAKCQTKNWARLCSKAEVQGWAHCAYGWMSNYKGYWFDRTQNGCGSGIGFRNGDSQPEVGAYCCGTLPLMARAFIRDPREAALLEVNASSVPIGDLHPDADPEYNLESTREMGASWCRQQGYRGLCTKAEVKGFGLCKKGWMEDFTGYWLHTVGSGCDATTTPGYRSYSGTQGLGAYCCHAPPAYLGSTLFYNREDAESACKLAGYEGLCSMADVEGHPKCSNGWMSDFRGFWYHQTETGCGTGEGFRTHTGTSAGAYCCSKGLVHEDAEGYNGKLFALHNFANGRYVSMSEQSLAATQPQGRDDPPLDQPNAQFLVVAVGRGEVALHSLELRRFIRMTDTYVVKPSGVQDAADEVWTDDRFKILRCGDDHVCFYNAFFNNFLSMRTWDSMVRTSKELGKEVEFAMVEIPGTAGYTTLHDQACRGVPYTYNPCHAAVCNGWKLNSLAECWEKCVKNEYPSGCDVGENTECHAAVWEPSGRCQLYDGQCSQLSWEGGTITRVKKFFSNFKQVEKRRCSSSPFTENAAVGCNGFQNVTADQCQQKCEHSAHAPNCPHKVCAAAMYWGDTKVCHLYDACDSWVDASDGRPGTAIIQSNVFKHIHKAYCVGTPYTQQAGCNGFSGVSMSQCQALCQKSASPCGVAATCRAAVYNTNTQECQLHDQCDYQGVDLSGHYTTLVSVLPTAYRNFKFYNGKRCSTAPYTLNLDANPPCNGFHGYNEYQCQAACENNNVPAGCPQKLCVAAVFYPSLGQCHLHDSCSRLFDDASARTIRAASTTGQVSLLQEEPDVVVEENPFDELATAFPSVIMNATNFSGVVVRKNESIPGMSHVFGDVDRDLELLYDLFEGFWGALHRRLEAAGDDVEQCPARSYMHLSGCISLGLCILQGAVEAQHLPMDYFTSMVEIAERFLGNTWPSIRQALFEEDEERQWQSDVMISNRCDSFSVAYENAPALLQLDGLDAEAQTLAISQQMLHATQASHKILDAHQSNSSMDATLQSLEDAWKLVCHHLQCDPSRFWDLHAASYKQTISLAQVGTVRHVRDEIQGRYRLEQRMQRWASEHQDPLVSERYWREHDRRHDEGMQLYGQRGRKAVLSVVEHFAKDDLDKALALFDRDVLLGLDDEEQKPWSNMSLVALEHATAMTKPRWLKKLFKFFKCFGQVTLFSSTGYWLGTAYVGFTFGYGGGASQHFLNLLQKKPPGGYVAVSAGLAVGKCGKYFAGGVSASVSLSAGCSGDTTVSLGVSALFVGVLPITSWIGFCPLGPIFPSTCMAPGAPKCGPQCSPWACMTCSKIVGVSVSLFCCSWNLATRESSCR